MVFVGSAYTYLQEWLPNVGQYTLRHGMTDFVGLGRMMLSYPELAGGRARGPPADAQARVPDLQRLHDRSTARTRLRLLPARSVLRRAPARADPQRSEGAGQDMNRLAHRHERAVPADRRGPDGLPLALCRRRLRALRPAALLSVLRAGARLDAAAGHVGERVQQDLRRAGVRVSRRPARRSLRPAPAAARRDRDGRRRARRPFVCDEPRRVLSLLHVQRARVCVRRAAAKPGAAVAMVRQGSRQGDGDRLSRDRRRRRARAAARVHVYPGVWLARRASHPRAADDRDRAADGVLRPRARAGRALRQRLSRCRRSRTSSRGRRSTS